MRLFYIGVGLVVLSATGFGLMPILAIAAYQENVNVTTLLFLRFSIAAVVFFAYVLLKIRKLELSRFHWIAMFVMGGVFYTAQSSAYFSSIKYIPASLTALLFYSYPVFVAILSFFVNKEGLSKHLFFSIGICILGITMVLGTSFGTINPWGVLLAIAAALVYSCYIVLGSRVVSEIPSVVTSAFVALFASLSFLFIGLSTNSLDFNMSLQGWAASVGIALFCTVLAMVSFFYGLKLIGSTKAAILSMVEPLVTIGFAALLLGERLTALQFAGGLTVLGGAMLVVFARVQTDQEKPQADDWDETIETASQTNA